MSTRQNVDLRFDLELRKLSVYKPVPLGIIRVLRRKWSRSDKDFCIGTFRSIEVKSQMNVYKKEFHSYLPDSSTTGMPQRLVCPET